MKIGKTKVKTKRQFNPEIKEKIVGGVGKVTTLIVKGFNKYDTVIVGSVISGATSAIGNKILKRN